VKKLIFKFDIDGIKMTWHFGTIDALFIRLFGTIILWKGKEEGSL
tara:strand:+ start:31 stop:165 length:135 start_codon:yes stop_codon:yes gene_type:complete